MRLRHLTAVIAVTFTTAAGTVVYAQEEPPPETTTTTTAPEPVVTIVVEDVPAPDPVDESPPSEDSVTDEPATTSQEPEPEPETASEPVSTPPVETQPSTSTETAADEPPATTDAAADVTTTTHNPVQIDSSETAIVDGTQVAEANTGANVSHNEQTPQGGTRQPNEIDTGDADAIGSQDTNVVTQEAEVTLSEQAVANLLQVALILNIGAALANSGINDVISAPGGDGVAAAIDSGSATAIGNDMEQYITQAARAMGDENTDDAATQLAVSLWMGLASANSGINSATGTGVAGSGGSVGTGDASAIGNQSLTDVLQQAALSGSGTSEINVAQYATVMNIGFALANSGVNDISGVATGLLTAGDSETQNGLALDLFSMLLPALLSSFTGTSGQGQIGTGDATAIGNRSETYVHQIAEAASSGDGIATILQDVLVANVGAAGANTGGNTLGGRYASLDSESAKAVVTLAAFLSQMLALVHTRSAETALAMQQQGMQIPFGDIVLQVQGQLQGVDTTLTNESGARANIRQMTIILSLGIAESNTGLNRAIGIDSASALAASVNSGSRTATGNALAGNEGLVIICQRRNADDVECLAPPEEETTTTTTTTPPDTTVPTVAGASDTVPTVPAEPPTETTTPSGTPQGFAPPTGQGPPSAGTPGLAATGSNTRGMVYLAAYLVLIGGFILVVTRRRRLVPARVAATRRADPEDRDGIYF